MTKAKTIQDVLRTLVQHRVQFAVVGGVAVVLHGYVRLTKDIDVILDFSKENIERFMKALEALQYKPGPPIDPRDLGDNARRKDWIEKKNAKVITFYDPESSLLQLDVLLNYDLAMIRVENKTIDDFSVQTIEYNDLIKMKTESGRTIDLLDIEKLGELHK
jgi:acylphosphatase